MKIFRRRKEMEEAEENTRISPGTVIREGRMTLEKDLHVDGYYEGSISTPGRVVVGRRGRIEGSVISKKIVISGIVEGEIDCDTVEVMDGGTIIGKIATVNFVIGNGGIFEGTIQKKDEV